MPLSNYFNTPYQWKKSLLNDSKKKDCKFITQVKKTTTPKKNVFIEKSSSII